MNNRKIYCSNCGVELTNEPDFLDAFHKQSTPCPKCGSIERHTHLFLDDEVQIKDDTSMNLSTPKPAGGKKLLLKGKYGSELHHDSNTWQERNRTIDIANNNYNEVISNPATGFYKEVNENLSDHEDHGSAK